MFAFGLRALAGLIGFAGEATASLVDSLADRIDPPEHEQYARFDKTLVDTRLAAPPDDGPGFFTRLEQARIARAEQAGEGQR